MILDLILLAVGFVALVLGADWLVDGASGLAKRLNIPDLVIGMTVLAFGTSMPEMVVNLMAAAEGSNEIALTNILGSNVINVLVILGVSAMLCPIVAQRNSIVFDIPLSILAGLMILLMGTEYFGLGNNEPQISRFDGIVLLAIFALFMGHMIIETKRGNSRSDEHFQPMTIWKALLLMAFGMAGLVVGGELIVRNAVKLAQICHVSEAIIGVTIVALGTSLPELATSAMAAAKKNTDLAIGNIIGSNIFNVFFVLGTSAVIHPLKAYPNLTLDATMATICSVLVLLFVCSNKQHALKRWHGAILLLVYAAYLTWLLINI